MLKNSEIEGKKQIIISTTEYQKHDEELLRLNMGQEDLSARISELERIAQESKRSSLGKTSTSKLNKFARNLTTKDEPIPENKDFTSEIELLSKSFENYATKKSLETLKQSFTEFQTLILSKVNIIHDEVESKKDSKTDDKFNPELENKLAEIEVLKSSVEKLSKEHTEDILKINEDLNEFKDTLKRILDMINSLKFSVDDITKELDQRANEMDVTILKQSVNEYLISIKR